jgi:cell division protease FtsH
MEFGQSREYSEEVAARIDREVSRILESCYNKAREILQQHRERMDQLTEALLKQETLNRAEFVALMDEGIMPDGTKADKPRTVREILAEAKAEEAGETLPEAKIVQSYGGRVHFVKMVEGRSTTNVIKKIAADTGC